MDAKTVAALLLLTAISSITCQNIRLIDNGYEGILLAISESIKYDAKLLSRIQAVFTEASTTLYSATNNRAYFKSITILIPSSWPPNVRLATTETFDKANIRIDLPAAAYGNQPRVEQTTGCGLPGDFMHLTPQYLLNKATANILHGPYGKVIVHEWGHLRWGLFDEYPMRSDSKQTFYSTTTSKPTLESTRCTVTVHGKKKKQRTEAPSNINLTTLYPELDCQFYADSTTTTVKNQASMTYEESLPAISRFCDDDPADAETYHNYESSSQHNKHCGGKSSWSIMNNSVDFVNGANPSNSTITNTDPIFNIIKRRSATSVVLVMDVSGSMIENNNYLKLAAAVKRYLLYTVQTGSFVGLVKYSTTPTTLTPSLVEIRTNVHRNQLANLIVPEQGGKTAIGQGLLAAQKLLEAGNTNPAGSRIVLLTDGQENKNPRVAEVKPGIISKGIVVDTILLTKHAAPVLISLAASTGGLSFYSSGADNSTSLSDAYTKSERDRYADSRLAPVTILSQVTKVEAKDQRCFAISIDATLGRDSTFIFTWVSGKNLAITVTNPNGTAIPLDTSGVSRVEAGYRCVDLCPTGKWSVCMRNNGDHRENVVSQVESTGAGVKRRSSSTYPITVRTRIVNSSPSFNQSNSKPTTILATVTQGYNPVIGADVYAILESPDPSNAPTKLVLRDVGAVADIVKDDGTYSAFIFDVIERGKHSISVHVDDRKGQTKLRRLIAGSKAAENRKPGYPLPTAKLTPVTNLQRHSLAGFVDVIAPALNGTDLFPPSRVIDLQVLSTSYSSSSVTLSWTAVGDDVDKGKALGYRLWQSHSHKDLLQDDLSNATEVNSSQVRQGSLQKVSFPYKNETITVQLNNRDCVTVFGLKVIDASGNSSPMSNIVSIKPAQAPHISVLANNGSIYKNTSLSKQPSTVTVPPQSESTKVITALATTKVTPRSTRRRTSARTTKHTRRSTRRKTHRTSAKPTTTTPTSISARSSQQITVQPTTHRTIVPTTTKTPQTALPCECLSDTSTVEPSQLQGLTHSQLILIVSATVPVVVVVIVMIFVIIAIKMRGHDDSSNSNNDGRNGCPVCEAKRRAREHSAHECPIHKNRPCCES